MQLIFRRECSGIIKAKSFKKTLKERHDGVSRFPSCVLQEDFPPLFWSDFSSPLFPPFFFGGVVLLTDMTMNRNSGQECVAYPPFPGCAVAMNKN